MLALALGLSQGRVALRGSGLDTSKDGVKAPSAKKVKAANKSTGQAVVCWRDTAGNCVAGTCPGEERLERNLLEPLPGL